MLLMIIFPSSPLLSKTQIRNCNSLRISNTLKLLSSHTMQFINQYVYSNQRKSLQRREKIVPERKKEKADEERWELSIDRRVLFTSKISVFKS